MLHLDGSTLEGGGQLVRNALALSALTSKPVKISRIRGNRKGARGLKASHTAAVKFLAEACGGSVSGAQIGSTELIFLPRGDEERHGVGSSQGSQGTGEDEISVSLQRLHLNTVTDVLPIKAEYDIRLPTPGSVFLIFQALYPYLLYAGACGYAIGSLRSPIKLTIAGGTNVSFSPSYDYVSQVLIPNFSKLGLPQLSVKLNARGWSSGRSELGSVTFTIEPLRVSIPTEDQVMSSISHEAGSHASTGPAAVRGKGARVADEEDEAILDETTQAAGPPLPTFPKFPILSVEELECGTITQIDITVLAPDTPLRGPAIFAERKNPRKVDRTSRNSPNILELQCEYDSEPQTIRELLEYESLRTVSRAFKRAPESSVLVDNIRAAHISEGSAVIPCSAPVPPGFGPSIKLHTTEPTQHHSRIYLLLVVHTSTGFRLGRDVSYSTFEDNHVPGKGRSRGGKKIYASEMAGRIRATIQKMVNQCVEDLKQEVQNIDRRVKGTAKGSLDTFMRDQVVVFEALGKLGVIDNARSSSDSFFAREGEEELSLHTRTAMWVCEQVLGVRI